MTTTTFIGTPPFSGDGYAWNQPENWSNGVPQAGESVAIGDISQLGSGTTIKLGDLALSGLSMALTGPIVLEGNAVTLSNTTVTGFSTATGFDIFDVQHLVVGHGSFMGDVAGQVGGFLTVQAATIDNTGVIGAESGGGVQGSHPDTEIADASQTSKLELDNAGKIVATNGGVTEINNAEIVGRGALLVNNGGILSLNNTLVGGDQRLVMGGQTGSTVNFDPLLSPILGDIYGFGRTDLMDLQNFFGTAALSGTTNPVLTLTGIDSGQFLLFNLNLHGNYTNYAFSTSPDASGTGTLLLVHHT